MGSLAFSCPLNAQAGDVEVTTGENGAVPIKVDLVEELGSDAYVYGSTEVGGERRPVIARVDGRTPPSKGAVLHLAPREGALHLFAGDSGERIAL